MAGKKRTKNQPHFNQNRVYSFTLALLLGVILFLTLIIRLNVLNNQLVIDSSATKVNAAEDKTKTQPTFLRIPSLNIALVVKQTTKTNDNGYAVFNYTQKRNTEAKILYAAKEPHLFQSLGLLTKGDDVLLLTQDGTLHEYVVTDTFISTFTKLSQSQEQAVFLTTPEIFNFQKRLVVKAIPAN